MLFRSMNQSQAGATLMEVLVAMSISLVVTASMVALMANSLSTTTRIIQMSKLADDLRLTMQMMSRDVRRSNFNADSMFCYASEVCATSAAGDVAINDTGSCFTFLLDRNYDGDSTNDAAGGFRRVASGTVGVIEMWTGDGVADCADAPGEEGWVQITDPATMDVFAFTVDDALSDNDPDMTVKVRKIRMGLQGRLVLDNSISKQLEDTVSVRNLLLL